MQSKSVLEILSDVAQNRYAVAAVVGSVGLATAAWMMKRSVCCGSSPGERIRGKVFVITGASSGIGYHLTEKLLHQGARVMMIGRDQARLNDAYKNITKSNDIIKDNVATFAMDIGDLDRMPDAINDLRKQLGIGFGQSHNEDIHIDYLVNNAGISQRSDFVDTTLDTMRRIFEVNFFGPLYFTKMLLPQMYHYELQRPAQLSMLINVCSLQSYIAMPGRTMYSSSKSALRSFSAALRSELAEKIDVMVVCPGYTKTAVFLNALTGTGERVADSFETAANEKLPADYEKAMSVEKVADGIVKAIRCGKQEIAFYNSIMQRIAVVVERICPSLVYRRLARTLT